MSVEASSVLVHVGANIQKRFRTSATTRTQEYKAHICTITKPFSLLQTLPLDTKTKRTRRRFLTRRTIDGKSLAARKNFCADLKYLGCVDRWNTDERDPHQHAGALQHARGREKVAHARSTSNAVYTVIKRAARKSVTHVANGTTSRGVHNTTKSIDHPGHSLAFQMNRSLHVDRKTDLLPDLRLPWDQRR